MTSNIQASLFDGEVEEKVVCKIVDITAYEVGDRAHVIVPPHKADDIEAYYYLIGFKDKRGIISKVIEKPSLQYEVEVGNLVAHVYQDELQLGWVK